MTHADDLARLRADVDQAVSASAELAKQMRAYFTGLVEEGFDRKEALQLTIAFQHSMFQAPGPEGD